MKRGEVWQVSGLGRDRVVLLVGNDAINDLYPSVQAVEIADRTTRATLVTVPVETPVPGVALVATVGPTSKRRLTQCLGTVPAETMDDIAMTLRAVYDLEPAAGH